MIEADTSHPPGIAADEGLGASHQVVSSDYMLQRRQSFVSFDVFREKYWDHFPQPLTKGLGPLRLSIVKDVLMFPFLDASLVFSEFMGVYYTAHITSRFIVDRSLLGVIKGSETTLISENHFLDYDTYLNLSARTQATFASRRKEIYALFETYMKMKRDRGEYDAADR